MRKYLVCGLNDEDYTYPDFVVCETLEEAQNESMRLCKEFAEYYDDENPEYEDEQDEMRLTVNVWDNHFGVYGDERFYVTEIKELDGDYALVEHHAYDGVDFTVIHCGTWNECIEKKKEWTELCQKEFDTEEYGETYDTGVEWIHISLVNLKEN